MNSSRWLALVMLVALSGCSACGDKSSAPSEVDSNQRSKALLQRLQTENVNFWCEEIPLGDVFRWFSMNLGLEFEPSADIQLNCAVSITLRRNTIAAALDRFCLRYDLAWKLEQETIVVEVSPLAQRSAELRKDLRKRKFRLECVEEPIRVVFGILSHFGVPIEIEPEVELTNLVTISLPTSLLCDLLDSLTEALELEWAVYGGAVHIEKAALQK